MRTDKPRQAGMDRWKGPHSGIIAATLGLYEYRQIHLAENNPGRWPETPGIETTIPEDRRIEGIAEVTFENARSPLAGRKQTAVAFEDEINIFGRTLLHAGPPGTSRWYDVAPGQKPGSRAVIYLRRGQGEGTVAFHKFLKKQLTAALIDTGVLKELRTQVFLPWSEKTWDTPNVAHDNPMTSTCTPRSFSGSPTMRRARRSRRSVLRTSHGSSRRTCPRSTPTTSPTP
jgi:hypothetical protein